MEKSNKIGSEITVRISLTFQDAPDVHTLLAMTPVRQRGKLVRLALERYIVETGHTAGNVDAQIEAISGWLRGRNTASITVSSFPENATRMESINPVDAHVYPSVRHQNTVIVNTSPSNTVSVAPVVPHPQVESVESPSMTRWLQS